MNPESSPNETVPTADDFQAALGIAWACMRCGQDGILRPFSLEGEAGLLYVASFKQPGFDSSNIQLLCNTCWPQWLMWSARMGHDLHTHAKREKCDLNCLARQGGRKAQYASLRSIDRRSMFALAKAVDGMPQINGTPMLVSMRVGHYLGGAYSRQGYYESIGEADTLAKQLISKTQLQSLGVPTMMLDAHLLVIEIFESANNAAGGKIMEPTGGDRSRGWHCVAVEEFDEASETFRFWNSWGSGWGDHGYGTVSLQYVRKYYLETFLTKHARWGPSPHKPNLALTPSLMSKDDRRPWTVQNPREVSDLRGPRGRSSRWVHYETISPVSGDPVSCLEVRTGFGLRMGWAFLRHLRAPSATTEVTELYVWPTFRRLGIGSWLEESAVRVAESRGSTEIQLIMNDADSAIGPVRRASREFLKARGYSIRWRPRIAPRSPATGVKAVSPIGTRTLVNRRQSVR